MSKIIVGLGEILWDVFPSGKVLGGAPANFAYHVSQLGYDGYAVSAVGRDGLGDEVLENISAKKLDHMIERSEYPTGTVMVELDDKGIPTYVITKDVAWDYITFSDEMEVLAKKTRAVCFGTLAQRSPISRGTFFRFFEAMPIGGLKIFDINLRQDFYSREVIEESLKISDILKINDEELVVVGKMFGLEGDEVKKCKELMERYDLGLVVLTKGTGGSVVISNDEISSMPTPVVDVADTVGAGDAFTAAFIASYLDGNPIAVAHEFAVKVSAFTCTQKGAMPELDHEAVRNIRPRG